MVTGVWPVLVTVNVLVTLVPTATAPNALSSSWTTRCPGVPLVPVRPADSSPPSVSRPMASANVPACVGSKSTVALIAPPGGIVSPACGASGELKGACGRSTALMVSAVDPTLRNVTEPLRCPPTLAPPKETMGGVTASCGPAAWPLPVMPNAASALLDFTVSVPPYSVAVVGAKVTGTSTDWPACSVSGSVRPDLSTANAALSDTTSEIVTSPVAVTVSVRDAVSPTVVVGNVSDEPVTGGLTGEPKPSTWPSRVPTKIRPAPTPGIANFAEWSPSSGALQRSTGCPP